jgi:hypothetical protein
LNVDLDIDTPYAGQPRESRLGLIANLTRNGGLRSGQNELNRNIPAVDMNLFD